MRWRWVVIMLAAALVCAVGVGGYVLVEKVKTALRVDECTVALPADSLSLDLDQAANAATIAAVAYRKKLPARALVIAYATAEQESHIENLPFGDRDSVGIFQQRPSQGWGRADQLQDPVYSTNRFFDALVKVKDYEKRPLHDAAQRVQRSADGSLYAQHEPMGKILAEGFGGTAPASVTCWYGEDPPRAADATKALRELRRAFGSRMKTDAQGVDLPAGSPPAVGWSVASWAVAHASRYGLTEVRHAGKKWTRSSGNDGWSTDGAAPAEKVLLR
ncbi:hypothetical protein [Actinocorallia longicatena]|uniref:Uncharacterized protein n=1 Tax=Actinocorallia longicatena TaxID=111803 RepID=A0ABP6QHJ3_9ACTN